LRNLNNKGVGLMKRLALLAACSVVAFMFAAVPASADNGPHVMGAGVLADGCAGCHRVHTAKTDMLTMEAQPQLCYTCHSTSGTGADTDVVGGVGRGQVTGALRGGGFEYALIDSANPTGQSATRSSPAGAIPVKAAAPVTSTHSVDGSDAVAWGNGAISGTASPGKSIGLRCGSCHDPHGNGNYRILRAVPNDSGAAEPGVVIKDTATKVYTTANYWKAADTNAPTFIANVSAWCSTCHTRYLAPSDSGVTDSNDAIYRYRHMSSSTSALTGRASCIQCHVSHGSNASMGTFSNGVGDPGDATATGGSKLLRIDNRGTCQMCHLR
jgi:predicted CXXCH cytochrome family protein